MRRDERSIASRRDHRTEAEFIKDIKTYTKIEAFIMDKWVREMRTLGHDIEHEDAGVDNDGGFVPGTVGVNADYKVTLDGEDFFLIDVKHNYNDATATFKKHNLEAYAKNSIHMLVVVGTGVNGRNVKPENFEQEWQKSLGKSRWALVNPDGIRHIMDKIPIQSVKWMGGRPGFVIYGRNFGEYFNFNEFYI